MVNSLESYREFGRKVREARKRRNHPLANRLKKAYGEALKMEKSQKDASSAVLAFSEGYRES